MPGLSPGIGLVRIPAPDQIDVEEPADVGKARRQGKTGRTALAMVDELMCTPVDGERPIAVRRLLKKDRAGIAIPNDAVLPGDARFSFAIGHRGRQSEVTRADRASDVAAAAVAMAAEAIDLTPQAAVQIVAVLGLGR
ncbi:hypothetical protein [Rhizobium leguminosarum]|uniref:hypothetical protein n=1 Tax=Rhizobium leguminosarum TaxID=384 RepID=UPI001C950B36|nr:hypothetical protein [Rhizobium leguminosarum]MBY5579133.1 hypothetical protein [Rhizobium leguminosarum]